MKKLIRPGVILGFCLFLLFPLFSGNSNGSSPACSPSSRNLTCQVKKTPQIEKTASETCYYGSINTKVFHRPDCRYAKKIKKNNLKIFKSKSQAEKAGYRPCKVCKP